MKNWQNIFIMTLWFMWLIHYKMLSCNDIWHFFKIRITSWYLKYIDCLNVKLLLLLYTRLTRYLTPTANKTMVISTRAKGYTYSCRCNEKKTKFDNYLKKTNNTIIQIQKIYYNHKLHFNNTKLTSTESTS